MGKETTASTLRRIVWLLDTIYRAGERGITRAEISERWAADTEMSGGEEYPRNTFTKHIARQIPDIFDVEIECTPDYRYRMVGAQVNELTEWLVETISLKNAVAGEVGLQRRILFEPAPAGQKLLRPIIEAMRASRVIEIDYHRFSEASPTHYTVEPYFLKLFRRRWYLVGLCREMERIYTFSLDRLLGVTPLAEGFTMPPEAEGFFAHNYGIIWNGAEPAIVRLRVYGKQVDYIRSLPLHHSQKELASTEGYTDFEYFVRPTYDFEQELLSHGASVEVLKPEALRTQMRQHTEALLKLYQS